MRAGVWILSVFAAIWGIAGVWGLHAPAWAMAIPVGFSTLLIAVGARGGAPVGRPELDRRRAGRAVGIWSAAEGVAILAAVNALRLTGHPDLAAPAIAAIVGLHFFPLAGPLGVRIYHATGAALLGIAAVGVAMAPDVRIAGVGLGSAAVLWLTAAALVGRIRTGPERAA